MSKRKLIMKRAEDALQIWPVLVWAARNQQTMTYKDLSELTDIDWNAHTDGGRMSKSLEIIYRYCETELNCFLTVLIVGQKSGTPGTGLSVADDDFDKARQKIFGLSRKKGFLRSPGLEKLKQFIIRWNKKNF